MPLSTRLPTSATRRPQVFRSGQLDCLFSNGDVRYVRIGGVEIVRRVYFVTRDHNWNNVPQPISGLETSIRRGGFTIGYQARSNAPGIRVDWKCHIECGPGNILSYTITGRAQTAFQANRVGLCLHLPLEGFAGKRFHLVTSRGASRSLTLSRSISPQQPCTQIRSLRFQPAKGCRADLEFSGEEFEIEDQRNWIDGSYKIYVRPLARGYPFRVEAGETFAQSVELRCQGPSRPPTARGRDAAAIAIGPLSSLVAPDVGALLPPSRFGPVHPVPKSIAGLGLKFLRGDIEHFGRALRGSVTRLVHASARAQLPLELALFFTAAAKREARALQRVLARLRPPVARFLVFTANHPSTLAASLAAARNALSPFYPRAEFASGSDLNFAELNRARRDLPQAAVVSYSANPQVHAHDERSIVECLEGLRHSLASAHTFFPRCARSLSVLTLKPRKNAVATVAVVQRPHDRYDVRQGSDFCAAWTAAALGHLQESGLHSVTLFETAGQGGLASGSGKLLPVGRVVQRFLACPATGVRSLRSSHPLRFGGWARNQTAAIANLTDAAAAVAVTTPGGSRRRLRLAPFAVKEIEF